MDTVIKKYHHNDALRHSFNQLAQKTFGLDFEDWYQNGYWGENYTPYSIAKDQEIIANVSVNTTNMMWNGKKRKMIQLGTVMTAEAYRNQGLIRKIMEEIEADYEGKVDGMYLFANDSVLDFYPKFGFQKAVEYQYSKEIQKIQNFPQFKENAEINPSGSMTLIPMQDKEAWDRLEQIIQANHHHEKFDMVDNSGLFLFYVTKFMQESVYYSKELDAYAIAELEDGELLIHSVFSGKKADLDEKFKLDDVILAFGSSVKKVVLGFVPQNPEGYHCEKLYEEDTTLFVKGDVFEEFEAEKLMFPTLAHA